MGSAVHCLASHAKHLKAVLNMKAFVAILAALAASVQGLVLPFYPYAGVPVVAGPAPVAPVIAPAAVVPTPSVSSQFQSQDEFKNLAHGYSNINSAKHESGNAYLGVSGSYSFVDANGELQTTNYVADGLGFRVSATNLPVAPAVPEVDPLVAPVFNLKAPVFEGKAPVFDLVGPSPVEDTEEVKAAKAEFQAVFDEAASRVKRSTPASTAAIEPLKVVAPAPLAVAAPFAYAGAYAPYAYAGGYAGAYAPYTYAGAYAPHTYAGAYAPYTYAPAYAGGLAPYAFPAATPVDYAVNPALTIPVTPVAAEESE